MNLPYITEGHLGYFIMNLKFIIKTYSADGKQIL